MSNVTILYFGSLAETFETRSSIVDLPNEVVDTDGLIRWLGGELEERLQRRTVRIAINQEMVLGNSSVKAGDEIAFMPPLSGG